MVRPALDGTTDSGSTRKPKTKPTTSYGDDHRSPTPTTTDPYSISDLLAHPTPTSSAPTSAPSTSSSALVGRKKPKTSASQSVSDQIEEIVNRGKVSAANVRVQRSVKRAKTTSDSAPPTPKPVNWLRTYTGGLAGAPTQPYPNQRGVVPVEKNTPETPAQAKPQPTYLDQHPLIKQQVELAMQTGDPNVISKTLGQLLSDKFFADNQRLSNRLDRKQQHLEDYYAEAKLANKSGDLDYTTDNPLNPKWLHSPSISGMNSPHDQRALWMQLTAEHPEMAGDLGTFFAGIKTSQYQSLGDFDGTIKNATYRAHTINMFRKEIETSKHYYDNAFKDASADEKIYNNWSKADEVKQDLAEGRAPKTSWSDLLKPTADLIASRPDVQKHIQTATIDDQGKLHYSMTKKEVKAEVQRRAQLGILNPGDLLSIIGSNDLMYPAVDLTDEQNAALTAGLVKDDRSTLHKLWNRATDTGPQLPKLSDSEVIGLMQSAAQDEKLDEHLGSNGGYNPLHMPWQHLNDAITGALKTIQDPTKDVVLGTIDKLARPIFGVNAMRQAWSEMDKSPGDPNKLNAVDAGVPFGLGQAYHQLTGKSFFDSVDDISVGNLEHVVGSGWGGFWDGGFAHNVDHPQWGSETIRYNADRDGVENYYDKGWYQTLAGLGSDLVMDPTMYVGLGPFKFIPKAIKEAKTLDELGQGAEDFNKTTQSVVDALTGTSQELDHEAVRNLLNGNWSRVPQTHSERIQHIRDVNTGVAHLRGRLDIATSEKVAQNLTSDAQKHLEYYGKMYDDRIKRVVGDHADNTYVDAVGQDTVDWAVANTTMSVEELAPHMAHLRARLDFNDEIAKRMGFFQGKTESRWGKEDELARETGYNSPAVLARTAKEANLKGSYAKLMAYKGTLEGEALAELNAQMDAHAAELIATNHEPGITAESIFGSRMADDTPFSYGEIYKALRKSRKASWGKQGKEMKRLGAIRTQISNQQAKLAKAKGSKIKLHQDNIATLQGAANNLLRIMDRKEAELVLKHVGVRETGRYQALKSLERKLEKEREKLGGDPGLYSAKALGGDPLRGDAKSYDSFQGRGVDVPDPNTEQYLGSQRELPQQHERPTEVLGGMHGPNSYSLGDLLQPHPAFGSKLDQIEHYEGIVQQQLGELSAHGLTNEAETANLLKHVPEGYIHPDGTFNWSEFFYKEATRDRPEHGFVTFNKNTRQYILARRVPDKIQDHWNEQAVEALNQHFFDTWKNTQAAGASRLEEEATSLAETAWAKHLKDTGALPDPAEITKLKEYFGSAEKGDLQVADPYTGELLEIGRDKSRFEDLASGDDIKRANEFEHWAKNSKAGAEAPQTLINYFRNLGYAIPGNRVKAGQWLKATHQNTLEEIKLYKVAAERLFRKTHGISIKDARNLRERTFGRVVGDHLNGGEWIKRHPGGVTKREFLHRALANKQGFGDMFEEGPFKLQTFTMLSEKQARDAAKKHALAELHGEPSIRPKQFGSSEWIDVNWRKLQGMSVVDQKDILSKTFDASIIKRTHAQEGERAQFIKDYKESVKADKGGYEEYEAKVQLTKLATEAKFDRAVETNTLTYNPLNYKLSFNGAAKDVDETHAVVREAAAQANKAERDRIRGLIRDSTDPAELPMLRERLQATRDAWKKEADRLEAARIEAHKSATVLRERLGEESILRAASANLATMQKQMQLGILGANVALPKSEILFDAIDKMTGLGGHKGPRAVWAKAFAPPSKLLGDDTLALIRARQVSMVPNIIEHHAKGLTHLYGKYKQNERQQILRYLYRGDLITAKNTNPELTQAVYDSLQPIVDHLGSKIGDATFNVNDLNRRLPQGINLHGRDMPKSVDDLLAMISFDATKIEAKTKRVRNAKFKRGSITTSDPWALAWELRIAAETAMGDLGMYHELNTVFGVKSGYRVVGKKGGGTRRVKIDNWNEAYTTVDKLQSEHGWDTLSRIPEQHRTHLFPAEAVEDINRLLDMLSPANRAKWSEHIDHVLTIPDRMTSGWKAASTMYNPGYYTRNGVGEIMSSIMAGVHGVKVYYKADRVLAMVNADTSKSRQFLRSTKLAKGLGLDKPVKATDVALTMRNGQKVTYDELWTLYNQMGLKTGFFNTEFEKQVSAHVGLSTKPGARTVVKGHRGLRTVGENYEDWLRLAHFIDVVEKSPGTLKEAGLDGAKAVRKYHFDYTDFSPFEKAVMMRVFPFYKWTRKAMPLMATLLFTHPGKMTAFPKSMNYVSNQLSNLDISDDPNGFAPNFSGIAPTWVQQLWGYQIAEEYDNGKFSAFRLATPQMDALNSLGSPGNTAGTLLNPIIKGVAEQAAGQSLTDNIPGSSGWNVDLNTKTDRARQFMRLFPQGSAFAKGVGENSQGEPNTMSRNDWVSFMTGLGFYDAQAGPQNLPNTGNEDSSNNDLTPTPGTDSIPAVGVNYIQRLLAGARRTS